MSEAGPYTCVLWDVDGVIADASAGIMPRVQQVLADLGRPVPTTDDLRAWIGPPMLESFERLAGLSPEESIVAVGRYRELASSEGYARSVRLYPGVAELIGELSAAGVPLSTASTKPENQVRAILEHYRIDGLFTAIAGARSDADIRDTKADVVGRALRAPARGRRRHVSPRADRRPPPRRRGRSRARRPRRVRAVGLRRPGRGARLGGRRRRSRRPAPPPRRRPHLTVDPVPVREVS